MQKFVDTINCCGLRDLGFIGPKFTWLYQREMGFKFERGLTEGLLQWIG